MAYQRPKPKYSLGIDSETTGFSLPNYAEKHQMISYGAVIVDNESLTIVDSLYNEIKFDESKYEWTSGAEAIHGISRQHLEEHGKDSTAAAMELAAFILKYFGPSPVVMILGHNPNFDIAFMRQLLEPNGMMPEISNRVIDSSVVAFTNLNDTTSNNMFAHCGFEDRKAHNALEDILLTVAALKHFRTAYQSTLK